MRMLDRAILTLLVQVHHCHSVASPVSELAKQATCVAFGHTCACKESTNDRLTAKNIRHIIKGTYKYRV
jgi:hypothetical protein